MRDWGEIRKQFPALEGRTFLNTATYGQTPRAAVEAMERHLARRDALACGDFLSWFDDMDRVREQCARLIHAQPTDIAFIHSASAGLGTFLNGLDWREGDEVLTVDNEFPNNLYQAPILARFGVTFRSVPLGELMTSLSERTRAVLLSAVNYGTGFRAPVAEWNAEFRKRGILLYLDGTQGCGAVRFDMREIRPAVFAVDAYKWMLTPNGGGFMYVDPEFRSKIEPSIAGWRSDRNWRDVNNLNHGDPVFSEDAEKYEAGMIVFPSLYAMGAVLDLMFEIGPARIEARVLELADGIRDILAQSGAEVVREASPIVTGRWADRDAVQVAQKLREQNVIVSARHGRLRVSAHFYNNEADLEQLRQALA
ncbi:hypothetical protein F183_A02350 [Bryobacterales bacterium F-183]|nr:hypothetical protein F183_A02350 [Bryobacterales bacterium F-183]